MGTLSEILGLNGGSIVTPILPLLPGQLPTYGSGRFWVIWSSQSFVVPAGVTSMRGRVFGGGGAIAEAGGSTSIAAIMSASGGAAPSGSTGGAGGTGSGGDFQASGGAGGNVCGGGGAVGSRLGVGGAGGNGYNDGGNPIGGGGGAVGGYAGGNASAAGGGGGASPFQAGALNVAGMDLWGAAANNFMVDGVLHASQAAMLFPFFGFAGGGGFPSVGTSREGGRGGNGGGGGGCLHTGPAGAGVMGGGGGGGEARGGLIVPVSEIYPPVVPYGQMFYMNPFRSNRTLRHVGGGGGGGVVSGVFRGGGGGGGYADGVFSVTPGQSLALTVAAQGTLSSGGLIILEA